MDFIGIDKGGMHAHGNVAQKLLANNMDVGILRPWMDEEGRSFVTNRAGSNIVVNASTLRKDEWKLLDGAVVKVAPQRLIGVGDLISRGLTYSVGGMGTTVLETETMSDAMEAQLSMDGATRGNRDRPEFDIGYMPLPIAHSDFQYNARQLAASRNGSTPLDTTGAELATRRVTEKVESMLFTGADAFTYGGGTLRGYQDHPNRNTGSVTAAWSAASGANIITDVKAMKNILIGDRAFGPYIIYVASDIEVNLDSDFKTESDITIRERIMKIGGIADIRVADFMTAGGVLMVQMTSDVVRLIEGLGLTTVEWSVEGGMITNFKVMAIMVPQIRADFDGRSGIAHWS